MPYELKPSEALTAGIPRLMREQITRIGRHLGGRQQPATRVHEARKRMKETRAILRLVRVALGPHFAIENDWFSSAAHGLAAARDATAVIEAVEKLRKHAKDGPLKRRFGHVKAVLRRAPEDLGDVSGRIAGLAAELPAAQERIIRWPPLENRFDTIGEGLERVFRDGRRYLEVVRRKPSAEAFHELRKRVKDHWYHARLLSSVWPDVLKPYTEVVGELARELGDHHDLDVLRRTIATEPSRFGNETYLRPVLAAIDERRQELEEKALRLADRVYAEKPASLRRRLRAYWRVAAG